MAFLKSLPLGTFRSSFPEQLAFKISNLSRSHIQKHINIFSKIVTMKLTIEKLTESGRLLELSVFLSKFNLCHDAYCPFSQKLSTKGFYFISDLNFFSSFFSFLLCSRLNDFLPNNLLQKTSKYPLLVEPRSPHYELTEKKRNLMGLFSVVLRRGRVWPQTGHSW